MQKTSKNAQLYKNIVSASENSFIFSYQKTK